MRRKMLSCDVVEVGVRFWSAASSPPIVREKDTSHSLRQQRYLPTRRSAEYLSCPPARGPVQWNGRDLIGDGEVPGVMYVGRSTPLG